MADKARAVRCAIYTRKSSEEGLEQDFNSLHAQREACEAYITSQKHEGWQLLPARYDDGGFSGGSMDRPDLARLLADITSGQINVVVVYKVDRLTRSLADFARIVEVFDTHGVSFVSVTQSFNTTTSMGRLTLNVLLSFAQFEREVTGERIRDKIAASKKKGLWMGGHVPIGYRAAGRTLEIDENEAAIVRDIYRRYLELRSVDALTDELDRQDVRTRKRTSQAGKHVGGGPFSRGHIYRILTNPIYRGKIQHKGILHHGQHPALIERSLWEEVQALLVSNRQGERLRIRARSPCLLAGLLVDESAEPLRTTHASKNGVRYRYYVKGRGNGEKHQTPALRLSAPEVENTVTGLVSGLLRDRDWLVREFAPDADIAAQQNLVATALNLVERLNAPDPGTAREAALLIIQRVQILPDTLGLELRRAAFGPCEANPYLGLRRPVSLRRRGVVTKLLIDGGPAQPEADPVLLKAVAQAHRWWRDLVDRRYRTMRDLAHAYRTDERYVARVINLAFLPTELTAQIILGTHPPDMTLAGLLKGAMAETG